MTDRNIFRWPIVRWGLVLVGTVLFFSLQRDLTSIHVPLLKDGPNQFPDVTLENYRGLLDTVTKENATMLFNTVSYTLRQKGSDLNPNGVSIVPALIKKGTILYHGTNGPFPSNPEWVAMDAEFSYNFANGLHKYRREEKSAGKDHAAADGYNGVRHFAEGYLALPDAEQGSSSIDSSDSHSLDGDYNIRPPTGKRGGVLLAFEVLEDLNRVIYLDGASASKLNNGEMDSQLLLARSEDSRYENFQYADQRWAVAEICNWGKQFGLDAIVRLETGFEGIICDFTSPKIKLISNTTFGPVEVLTGLPRIEPQKEVNNVTEPIVSLYNSYVQAGGYEHVYAGANVYSDEPRILADFAGMVTGINRTYLPTDTYKRRLASASHETKEQMIADLESYFKSEPEFYAGTNWQILTDGIVNKFGPTLMTLNQSYARYQANSTPQEYEYLARNISIFTMSTVRRYCDFSKPLDDSVRRAEAIDLLVYQYTHPIGQGLQNKMDRLIWSSIVKVAEMIANEIFDQFELSAKLLVSLYGDNNGEVSRETIDKQAKSLSDLLSLFDWAIFYRCPRQCEWNEVCHVPAWGPSPFGRGTREEIPRIKTEDCKCISILDPKGF